MEFRGIADLSKHSFRGIVYISAMPWQERGFMLYTNEEPLVQKTCIKTANLQHDRGPLMSFVMMRHKLSFVVGIDRSSCTIRIAWETASSART